MVGRPNTALATNARASAVRSRAGRPTQPRPTGTKRSICTISQMRSNCSSFGVSRAPRLASVVSNGMDAPTHPPVETGNESFRFRHSSATAKAKIKSREHTRKLGGESSSTDDTNDLF